MNNNYAYLTNLCPYAKSKCPYQQYPWQNIAILLNISTEQAKRCTQDKSGFAALVDRVIVSSTPW